MTAADRREELEAAWPLTCTWCHNSPATHLVIADWEPIGSQPSARHQHMLCSPCAHQTTLLPASVIGWWLFRLVPDEPFSCNDTQPAAMAGAS